jgi:alkylation response protein AidB-like acyl-CoA dehydrogenase
MDLNPSEEQQQLIEAFGQLYEKESSSERIREAEATGFDTDLWATLRETGVVEMAVSEAAGGWGATLLDLALVAEQHGRHVGSAPLIESQVAARLLERLGAPAAELLAEQLSGDVLVTVALNAPRGGVLGLAPAGRIADVVLFRDGEEVFALRPTGERARLENLGNMPVADLSTTGASSLASGPGANEAFEVAIDEWQVLIANALAGISDRSIEIGVEYVKERHAFGVPIGSFQAVSHGLANARTWADSAKLVSREAAWAADEDSERARELAGMAFGLSADAAREASYRSLHYHGGYGFMLEYDIQLYWHRAQAWPAQWGNPDKGFARAERARLNRIAKGA